MDAPRKQTQLRDGAANHGRDRLADALLHLEVSQQGTASATADPAQPAASGAAAIGPGTIDRTTACFSRDRRRYPRHEGVGRVRVFRLADASSADPGSVAWRLHAAEIDGTLIDISLSGVALVLNAPLKVGEALMLRITSRTFGCTVDQAARVIRTQSLEPGQWKVICRFKNVLPVEQVRLLGRQLSPAETRRLV